jgi:decaprenylphospho-beta-D-ribofuranose 2-oxidase
MKLTAWGRFPVVDAEQIRYGNETSLREAVCRNNELIAYGNGRSYGDCALATRSLNMRRYDRFIHFDSSTGQLTCEAGVLFATILETFLPRGWFLQVTPGTQLITVGGAIACDVHGKNHHLAGCFSETVVSLRILLADGTIVTCCREQHRELFLATCGGMGLTGVILEASFTLTRVASRWIEQRVIKTANLDETFAAFEHHGRTPYSVAWIDCLQRGANLGRSLLMLGEFSDDGDLDYRKSRKVNIPCDFPDFALNSLTVKVFNTLYYGKVRSESSSRRVGVDSFFYPLDALHDWNRMYGRSGFVQYHFILPKARSAVGMNQIISIIAESGMASFLAVLKLYGAENDCYLSFPQEGYSLALDFKLIPAVIPLLHRLDALVLEFGGRIYLAKDACMNRAVFEQSYPRLSAFREVRSKYDPHGKFSSRQSMRLGL